MRSQGCPITSQLKSVNNLSGHLELQFDIAHGPITPTLQSSRNVAQQLVKLSKGVSIWDRATPGMLHYLQVPV
jgi:hypothetical protein